MKNKIKNIIVTAIIVAAGLPAAASAQLPTIVPACARGAATPSLNCILVFFATVAQWILGISGSLALFYFVYGGVRILLSRGNANAVGAGKTILTQAVIGIIIIFGAYLAVNFLVQNVLKATGIPSAEEASQKASEGPLTEPLSGQKSQTPTSPTTPPQNQNTCSCYCSDINSDNEILTSYPAATGISSEEACRQLCESKPASYGQGKQIFDKCVAAGAGSSAPPPTPKCDCVCEGKGLTSFSGGIKSSAQECSSVCQLKGGVYNSCKEIK